MRDKTEDSSKAECTTKNRRIAAGEAARVLELWDRPITKRILSRRRTVTPLRTKKTGLQLVFTDLYNHIVSKCTVVDSLLFGKYTSEDITLTFVGYQSLDISNTILRTLALSRILPTSSPKVFSVSFTKNKQEMVFVNFVFDYTTSTFVVLPKLEESIDDGHGWPYQLVPSWIRQATTWT